MTSESKASDSQQKAKRVPAAIIIKSPNGNIIHKQAANERKGSNESMPQSSKKTIRVACFAGINMLYFSAG